MYGTFYTCCFASVNNQITGISQRLALESCMYQIDSDKMRCVLPYCPWTYPSIALRGGLRVPSHNTVPAAHSATLWLPPVLIVLRCLKIQHSPIFCDVFRDVFCAASPTYAIESSSYWASQVYGRRVALRLHAPALSSCIGASCLHLCIALRVAKIVLLLYCQSIIPRQRTSGSSGFCDVYSLWVCHLRFDLPLSFKGTNSPRLRGMSQRRQQQDKDVAGFAHDLLEHCSILQLFPLPHFRTSSPACRSNFLNKILRLRFLRNRKSDSGR